MVRRRPSGLLHRPRKSHITQNQASVPHLVEPRSAPRGRNVEIGKPLSLAPVTLSGPGSDRAESSATKITARDAATPRSARPILVSYTSRSFLFACASNRMASLGG